MDYIKTEKKLLEAQKYFLNKKKSLEQLSVKATEKISIDLKTEESLSASVTTFKLPLPVSGEMLGVGMHKFRYYTEEDLKWAVEYHNAQGKIPIKYDHLHGTTKQNSEDPNMLDEVEVTVGTIIGGIDKLEWDEATKSIKYKGHINDETHARNIFDGLVKEVSATIASIGLQLPGGKTRGMKPEFRELSIVDKAAYRNSTIKADI